MKKLKNIIEYIIAFIVIGLAVVGLILWVVVPIVVPLFFSLITNQYLFLLGYLPLAVTLLLLYWITGSRK